MTTEAPSFLERAFKRVLALRVPVVVLYAVLVPVAIWLCLRIPQDNSVDRFIVESDPDYVATNAFHAIFPETQNVLLMLESPDPFAPAALRAAADLETALRKVPGATTYSALSLWARTHPILDRSAESAAAFRSFVTGTTLFRRQGLVGDGFLGIAVAVSASDMPTRNHVLEAADVAVAGALERGELTRVRKVGRAYVEAWLEKETQESNARYLPLFGVFTIILTLLLYRSWRTLLAILVTLGATVALAVGWGHIAGYALTIISSIVPLTVLVTSNATLVYLHSRFVDRPPDVPVERHQIFALANKFVPVTASIIAAILGFAALGVSDIRPIREMGLWLAVGLGITWLTSFTLFPALQRLFKTPSGRPRHGAVARAWDKVTTKLPAWSYRWRWWLVPGAIAVCGLGTFAVFGLPGVVEPMEMQVDALDYVDPDLPLYEDMREFQRSGSGTAVARVWVTTPDGAATDPEIMRGLSVLSDRIQALPDVALSLGPAGVLRLRRYLSGQGDTIPDDPAAFESAAADLEQLLLTEPELRAFVHIDTLSHVQIMVVSRREDGPSIDRLRAGINAAWTETTRTHPALAACSQQVVGMSVLQAKIGANLVPTLTESFGLTAALIFLTFLIVFRSGATRLMAMIPSLVAILATFVLMRLTGIPLNVATILIATTVLGTTENDQVHFFYHFQESRRGGATTEEALRHAFRVSGLAILYATLINAAGFLALALSDLPPFRQFGITMCWAFLLSMLADFTALPAALWVFFREKPDAKVADTAQSATTTADA